MNRRSASSLLRILVTVMVLTGAVVLGPAAAGASTDPEPVPVSTEAPVTTANPFLPEEADLTSCVGMLQRPGCGSSARGGWRQYLVAGAMMGGLVLIFGRVAWGVARNRRHSELPPAS